MVNVYDASGSATGRVKHEHVYLEQCITTLFSYTVVVQ